MIVLLALVTLQGIIDGIIDVKCAWKSPGEMIVSHDSSDFIESINYITVFCCRILVILLG